MLNTDPLISREGCDSPSAIEPANTGILFTAKGAVGQIVGLPSCAADTQSDARKKTIDMTPSVIKGVIFLAFILILRRISVINIDAGYSLKNYCHRKLVTFFPMISALNATLACGVSAQAMP